jgi:hypothetical protein
MAIKVSHQMDKRSGDESLVVCDRFGRRRRFLARAVFHGE